MSTRDPESRRLPNGAALAAFAAAGTGAFAMGLIALLSAIGLVPVPTLYGPAGGVSGRTTLAVIIWMVVWILLHYRWRERDMETGNVHGAAIALTVVGILLSLPPVWSLFE